MSDSLLDINSNILNIEGDESKKKNKILIDKQFSRVWINIYFSK